MSKLIVDDKGTEKRVHFDPPPQEPPRSVPSGSYVVALIAPIVAAVIYLIFDSL